VKPAGIILDMDGVLCDSEDIMAESAARMFRETYGIGVHPREFAPYRGMGENAYLGNVARQHHIAWNLERDKARAYAIFLAAIRGRLRPLPGARDFVDRARQLGCRLAIATSADRVKLDGILPEIGLPHRLFDAIVTGSEVEHKKPDPEIFLRAAAKLGLPATQCLVVEDARSGVQAAKAAGCRCLALTTSLEETALRAAGADWVAPNLAAAPADLWDNR
jgi:HAD superfamily hydrolase (TIGR01509 family)